MNSRVRHTQSTATEASRTRRFRTASWKLLVTCFFTTTLSACTDAEGPERCSLSGFVTFDGIPLPSGVVRFVPLNKNGPGVSTTVIAGRFKFSKHDGPIVASHRVEIDATDFQGFEIDDEGAFTKAMHRTGKSPMAKNPIPAIYNRSSTLTAEVTGATEVTLRFDLRSGSK